ncbi:hypothetical protein VNI00_002431 [Paramarasmius palmivorus]|uniref:BZIP domain-containing protein n=1 Tax=Paramarasmius palmivorus TaxID=297713 RepID=A0AAW0DUL7_9AGAR
MPSHLNGLNIVHPAQPEADSRDLLAGSHFPDLSAQLALWTNLPFEFEDGPSGITNDDRMKKNGQNGEDEEEEKSGMAPYDSHVNVITGTNARLNEQAQQFQAAPIPQQQPSFDINTLLSGFGIDGFNQPLQAPQQGAGMSFAQLLALHSLTQGSRMPAQAAQPAPSQLPAQSPPSASPSSQITSTDVSPPAAKRTRTRKTSESVVESPTDPIDTGVTALAAAEDKRRRNTAASARFRLKKKEREIALENKAKELETRVNELERECEALRRENGWLKGLVVGVTGVATTAQAPQPVAMAPTGTKRPREDTS